jgi:GNAT superfamily N-acetyltransferase
LASFGRAPGGEVDASAAMVRAFSGTPALNTAAYARLDPGDADRRIDETLAWFAARRVSMTWWVGPATAPADLGPRLETHGLAHVDARTGMGIALDDLPATMLVPPGCTVERASDEAGLRGVAQAATLGFGFPAGLLPAATRFFAGLADAGDDSPWRFYLARDGDAPAATAGLFRGSAVAGIYIVATVPQARRRGLGAAVTAAALREARALGYRAAILQSTRMGHSVYRRLGFQDHCTFQLYRWAPPA